MLNSTPKATWGNLLAIITHAAADGHGSRCSLLWTSSLMVVEKQAVLVRASNNVKTHCMHMSVCLPGQFDDQSRAMLRQRCQYLKIENAQSHECSIIAYSEEFVSLTGDQAGAAKQRCSSHRHLGRPWSGGETPAGRSSVAACYIVPDIQMHCTDSSDFSSVIDMLKRLHLRRKGDISMASISGFGSFSKEIMKWCLIAPLQPCLHMTMR